MTHIEQAIKDYITTEFLYDKPKIVLDNDFPLIRGAVIDSMGIFKLIGAIEEQFEIKIQPEDIVFENFETVNTIKAFIMAKLSLTHK